MHYLHSQVLFSDLKKNGDFTFFFFGKDGRVMQTVHCSNHENLLFPNILVAVAVLVPINNPQSRRKDPLIDKCYVARRTDRFFLF